MQIVATVVNAKWRDPCGHRLLNTEVKLAIALGGDHLYRTVTVKEHLRIHPVDHAIDRYRTAARTLAHVERDIHNQFANHGEQLLYPRRILVEINVELLTIEMIGGIQ